MLWLPREFPKSRFFSAIIRNLPALIFIGTVLWTRPHITNKKWFLMALIVWMFGQVVSIAYGRAVGNLSSRYLDLFAIGILINFACLLSLSNEYFNRKVSWISVVFGVWIVVVLISLGQFEHNQSQPDLSAKHEIGLVQELNVKNYLLAGDINELQNKPLYHIPYPDPKRLASILDLPVIRNILPTNIRPSLSSMSVESQPSDAFTVNGFYPTTPMLNSGVVIGSYNMQGDAALGESLIRFDTNKQSALLEIPVAGYPLNEGIKIEIEQNDQWTPVVMSTNPKESWGMAYVKVKSGSFSIRLTDSSPTTWMAIGSPFIAGNLDAMTNRVLAYYLVFILLGLIIVLLLFLRNGLNSYPECHNEMSHE